MCTCRQAAQGKGTLFVGREAQQGADDAAEALQLHAVARPHEGAEGLLQVLLLGAVERGRIREAWPSHPNCW